MSYQKHNAEGINVFISYTLWNLSRGFVNKKDLHDVADILGGRSGFKNFTS